MKALLTAVALSTMALSANAFAQSPTSHNQPGSQANSSQSTSTQGTATSDQNVAAAQRIRQDLTSAGFTDVKVVAESFVVQAKTKDGNPVLMTIGPHGMSVFEAMNSGSGTVGSASAGANAASPATGSSSDQNAGAQK